jgi:DNA primase
MNYGEYFPIVDYYRKVVMPKSKKYWVKSDKKMVCPLHDDVNPSMGIIYNSNGEENYHCFGCNQWGDVVDLHKKVSRRLYKKYLSDEEALKDLCRLFNVSYEKVDINNSKKIEDDDIRRELAIREAQDRFDISDFQRMFTEGKMKKKSVAYFNTITMMMVNELKGEN